MTLNAKIGVLWIFLRFGAARHISIANCTEINWDRHGEAWYEIFSIERRFWRSKSRFSRFKETCTRGHQRKIRRKSHYFTVVGQSFMKMVVDRNGHAAYHNKFLVVYATPGGHWTFMPKGSNVCRPKTIWLFQTSLLNIEKRKIKKTIYLNKWRWLENVCHKIISTYNWSIACHKLTKYKLTKAKNYNYKTRNTLLGIIISDVTVLMRSHVWWKLQQQLQKDNMLLASFGHFRLNNIQGGNIFTQVIRHVAIRVDCQYVRTTTATKQQLRNFN